MVSRFVMAGRITSGTAGETSKLWLIGRGVTGLTDSPKERVKAKWVGWRIAAFKSNIRVCIGSLYPSERIGAGGQR